MEASHAVSVGICIGASNVKVAVLEWEGDSFRVLSTSSIRHDCDPTPAILEQLRLLSCDFICLTGRRLKERFALPAVTEPEAIEFALTALDDLGDYGALLSLGSENFIFYELDRSGHIIRVRTGNKCASGTGEFFLQQVGRMSVDADTAIRLAEGAEPFRVSGRCSVFCKSDCTHALNKGIDVSSICAGLGNMLAEKVVDLAKNVDGKALVVGGVTRNTYVMRELRKKIDIEIPAYPDAFEAVGAAICAFRKRLVHHGSPLKKRPPEVFTVLPPIRDAGGLVKFHERPGGVLADGDACILGLDVGSTTTKAVLVRVRDDASLASIYLRTDGNPVGASRKCYEGILSQVRGRRFDVIGLGVTGSGRNIAGLHAQTDGVINEIIAHATAAAYFDPSVDTILEIGGQDAKYTYLVNGVPCDYAMNEACSAGTGSFLEEAARESLRIDYRDIEKIALSADRPPNFNDQCAAFISSDIKNAANEGVTREDIVAGLVYSICMNYTNRVMGSRRIGRRVLMQGGVCYNRAVPMAMANLLHREIVVPPDPGLMGAFGVALEVKNRMAMGLQQEKAFDLEALLAREVEYGRSFACAGGGEKCDRGCRINMIKVDGRSIPFGGACSRYDGLRAGNRRGANHVGERQEMVFARAGREGGKRIGINRSFFMNTLYPMFHQFFTRLGMEVVTGDTVDPAGASLVTSSFCYPAEIAHGALVTLLKKDPDYIFLPQVQELFVEGSRSTEPETHCTCVVAQAEPYYLRSVFPAIAPKILSPVLNFSEGWSSARAQLAAAGRELGFPKEAAREAAESAVQAQLDFIGKGKEIGRKLLEELSEAGSSIAIVLFGRSYNAYAGEANLGIPQKFASRGLSVIPFDFLPLSEEQSVAGMSWAAGEEIIKAANFVKRHPRLFACYITNFSCGPDSFLVGYFRDIMKTKPSLTLELDSHSADAGINTRIEAFLDIVARYRTLGIGDPEEAPFTPARVVDGRKGYTFISSEGRRMPLSQAEILVPSMGRISTRMVVAALRGQGLDARAAPVPDFATLMTGRKNTSCKECLPMILTTGSLLRDLDQRKDGHPLVYFMPSTGGNCRFSQYRVFLNKLITEKRLSNVALWSLNSNNGYSGLGVRGLLDVLGAIIVADCLDDMRNAILALAVDTKGALETFEIAEAAIAACLQHNPRDLMGTLRRETLRLSTIELRAPLHESKKVLIAGEIYIRKDEFSSQVLIERLAQKGIVARRAPLLEWLSYVDYYAQNLIDSRIGLSGRLELAAKKMVQGRMERRIKSILARSGLLEYSLVDIEGLVRTGREFIRPELTGEPILVFGAFFREIITHVHGMISIGPFACLPSRVIESILNVESNVKGNLRLSGLEEYDKIRELRTLPFLPVECDGNPFPPIIESRIEAFALQVERVHARTLGQGAPAR